ncbi:MAG: glycoside hydrolase family 88 protein [Planctomycetes bacterium]|nr:glycoside hydrolase family 88 protein [Planctomycetota bacterium]
MTDILEQAQSIVKRVSAAFQARGSLDAIYCNDLFLEALLTYASCSAESSVADYVFDVMQKRNCTAQTQVPWKLQPFCHIGYALYQFTGDEAYAQAFVAESENYFKQGERSSDGLMVHVCEPRPQGAVLIDSMHDYCSRMAQAASLNGNDEMAADAVEQFQRHYQLLRYEDIALWRQGRDWVAEGELSPGTWSRGQGWILRGLLESCIALPAGSDGQVSLQKILQQLAEELLKRQDENGMWHILPHRPLSESFTDCSGTGLIIYNFALALKHGFLQGQQYIDAIHKAWPSLYANVDDQGIISNVSRGPGPLWSEEDYLGKPGITEDGEGHGPFALVFAAAAMHIIN